MRNSTVSTSASVRHYLRNVNFTSLGGCECWFFFANVNSNTRFGGNTTATADIFFHLQDLNHKWRVCNVCSMARLKISFSWKEGKSELEAKHGKTEVVAIRRRWTKRTYNNCHSRRHKFGVSASRKRRQRRRIPVTFFTSSFCDKNTSSH